MDHDALLKKVVGLLDKAERTEFEAERDSFIAKAQELISRHGIEHAVEQARLGDRSTETAVGIDVPIERPYVKAKVFLLTVIGKSNNCRVVYLPGRDRAFVAGFPSDIEIVELLYASLLTQGASALARETPVGNTRAFRNSFLLSFAQTVGNRLRAAAEAARQEYEAETGTSTALVLADRSAAADLVVANTFEEVRSSRPSASNSAGFHAGDRAGKRADLGQKRVQSNRGALAR